MDIVKWINDYWPVMVAAGVFLDAVAGYLPDRWVPYLGVIKRIVGALRGRKELAVLLLIMPLIGCAGQIPDDEMTTFAIESTAMILAYEIRDDFDWTDDTEQYYGYIMDGNLTLDGAKIAEEYLKTQTHPIIADRLVRLAVMAGFDLDQTGSIAGVENVDLGLLQAAARGFKSGLELE